MLKLRVQTAIVLVSLLGLSLYFLPLIGLEVLFFLILVIAGKEWAKLSLLEGNKLQWLFGLFVCGLTVFLHKYLSESDKLTLLQITSVIWLLFIVYCLFIISKIQKNNSFSFNWAITGFLVLPSAWLAILNLLSYFDTDRKLLFMLIAVVWVTDSGAYLVGKTIGKHKFSPVVSPAKTWQGVIGGVLLATVYGYSISSYYSENSLLFTAFILISAWFSIFGDLFESILKRQANEKDSGTILPGHGGILDRIDSMLAFTPLVVAGLRYV